MNKEDDWFHTVELGVSDFLEHYNYYDVHVEDTPARVASHLKYMVSGHVLDPKLVLDTKFESTCDQMVHRSSIRVVSTCAHHLVPFIGKAHFAYLPDKTIVGLSKIPRLIRCFAQRLQVQEELTQQIVDAFQEIVQPRGCALTIRAYHFCEIVRGAQEHAAVTETTAFKGSFMTNEATRQEFLQAINRNEVIFP